MWAFIGYGTSVFGVIVSDHGYVMVDTGDHPGRAAQALEYIHERVQGTLQGIVLTHSHPDHRLSGSVFTSDAEGKVPVWGHCNFGSEQMAGAGLEPVLQKRTAMQFGMRIPDDAYVPNAMVPRFEPSEAGQPLMPTEHVPEGGMELEVDGTRMKLLTLPTETSDHVQVWLPDRKVLFCGDSAYGSFPNLYPLRGGPYRDVELWGKNVRALSELQPEALMCGHNLALRGAAEIQDFLLSYADALDYVYNATIEGMNNGKTADELAAEIQLPTHLREKPFLAELYGSVGWSVRAIFAHKVGWFDGNPTNIAPLSPLEEAQRMATLAGSAQSLLARAQEALTLGDERWAARLAQTVLQLEGAEDAIYDEARSVLADAYEQIAAQVLPITAKNYLQTAARDLRAQ